MTRTLVVLPNDPLERYIRKGEVKERYYNPENLFDVVHVVTLADEDVSPEDARVMFGEAELRIHAVGRPSLWSLRKFARLVTDIVDDCGADAVRAYNPLLMGWYAVRAGERLDIPSVVSIHADYDLRRRVGVSDGLAAKCFWAFFMGGYRLLGLERRTATHATRMYAVYDFAARHFRGYRDEIPVIYNRVDLSRFANATRTPRERPTVLNVGRHDATKNPADIVRAVARTPEVDLVCVGDGPASGELRRLAEELGCSDRVEFIPSVPHARIHEIFAQCHIFAFEIFVPGVSIVILEAMAAGLPIVTNLTPWEDSVEVLGDLGRVVEATPDGYAAAIRELANDPDLRRRLGEAGRERVRAIAGPVMERREANLYRDVLRIPRLPETP